MYCGWAKREQDALQRSSILSLVYVDVLYMYIGSFYLRACPIRC